MQAVALFPEKTFSFFFSRVRSRRVARSIPTDWSIKVSWLMILSERMLSLNRPKKIMAQRVGCCIKWIAA